MDNDKVTKILGTVCIAAITAVILTAALVGCVALLRLVF